jgi:RNA polymerase sigma factor (TIGR02999 family)
MNTTPSPDIIPELLPLLSEWKQGDRGALDQAVGEVYAELRRLAHNHMRRENRGHTLQTTALVHETYLRLADCKPSGWLDRHQFFAFASRIMRHILVDYARRAKSAKRGAGQPVVQFEDRSALTDAESEEILALHLALSKLEEHDPKLARTVELSAFGGLTNEEVAETLGVSVRTVNRELATARAWLHLALEGKNADAGQPQN